MSVTETKMLAVTVKKDTADDFKALAKSNSRSVSGELRMLIERHIADAKKEQAA